MCPGYQSDHPPTVDATSRRQPSDAKSTNLRAGVPETDSLLASYLVSWDEPVSLVTLPWVKEPYDFATWLLADIRRGDMPWTMGLLFAILQQI